MRPARDASWGARLRVCVDALVSESGGFGGHRWEEAKRGFRGIFKIEQGLLFS